jgi:hypothetical protein
MKMTILPKAIYMFSAISTKIPMMFLTKIKIINLKLHMETQKIMSSQSNTEQKAMLEVLQYLTPNCITQL